MENLIKKLTDIFFKHKDAKETKPGESFLLVKDFVQCGHPEPEEEPCGLCLSKDGDLLIVTSRITFYLMTADDGFEERDVFYRKPSYFKKDVLEAFLNQVSADGLTLVSEESFLDDTYDYREEPDNYTFFNGQRVFDPYGYL